MSYFDDYRKITVADIEYVKNLYDAQVLKIKQEEYMKDLLYADYVSKVKSNTSRYDLFPGLFRAAQSQVNKKKKSERKDLAMLEELIREDFLNDDKNFKLVDIVCCGYEGYCWNVNFEFHGQEFYISIPQMDKIHIDNFKFANDGKFCFYIEESPRHWFCKGSGYDIKHVAKCIREYFKLDIDKQ